MSLHQFLLALRARARTFALVLACTVLATALISLVLPKTYVGTVALLVDKRDEQSIATGTGVPPRLQAGYLQTQLDIITSQKVARRVANDLGITRDAKVQRRYMRDTDGVGTIDDWVGAQLLKKLKTDTSQSSVIQIMYSGSDPVQAAEVANAFARAYMDTTLELRTEPTREAAAWFNEQVKELRTGLEQSQTRLAAYQKEKGIFASDERYDVENARLGELSTQLLQAQNLSYEASARQRHAQATLAKGASLESLPEVLSHPVIQGLTADVARAEARLQESSAYLGPAHPQYQRQQSEVRSLRAKLGSEMNKIASGLASSARQQSEREAELKNALAAQRAKVLGRKSTRLNSSHKSKSRMPSSA